MAFLKMGYKYELTRVSQWAKAGGEGRKEGLS